MGVKEYIDRQASPQKEIVGKLRRAILKAFPGIGEEIKLGVPWYGGKFYLVALKDHVNMGFSIEGLTKKEMDLFEGKGRFMRHLKFRSVKDVDEKKLAELMRIAQKSECSCP